MAEYIQLDEFDLSAPELNLSLSVWPNLFVSDAATAQLSPEKLHGLVRAGQLWFLSPSLCYFQIIIQFEGHSMNEAHRRSNILELLESSICLSTLWPTLGLSIKSTELRYETEEDAEPNLCFELEQPNKSSALLSPPGVKTSAIDGVICLFRFQSTSQHSRRDSRLSQNWARSPLGADLGYLQQYSLVEDVVDNNQPATPAPGDIPKYHQRVADLAVAALYKMVGHRTTFPGIRLGPTVPFSFLELAPTVWNAHYVQAIANRSRAFPIISKIISMASQWRRPLRNRMTEHLEYGASNGVGAGRESPSSMQDFAQRRLWTLMRTTLSSKMGMQLAAKKIDRDAYHMMRENMKTQLFRGYDLCCSGEASVGEAFDEKLPLENEPFDDGINDEPLQDEDCGEIHRNEQSESELPPHTVQNPRRSYSMYMLNDGYEVEHGLDHTSGTWQDSQLSGIDHDARSLPDDRFMLEKMSGEFNSPLVDENGDEVNSGRSVTRQYETLDHSNFSESLGMEYRGMAYSQWSANNLDTGRPNSGERYNTTSFSQVECHPLDRLPTFP